MTRVLLWKELREQWTVATLLVLVSAAILVGLTNPSAAAVLPERGSKEVISIALAWMCALIVGVQSLVAERESGTLDWLNALPLTRGQLWNHKVLFGLIVIAFQSAAILAVTAAIFRQGGQAALFEGSFGQYALTLGAFAIAGFSCGLFGSAAAGSSFGAIGWALAAQFAVALFLALLVTAIEPSLLVLLEGRTALTVLLVVLLPLPSIVPRQDAPLTHLLVWLVLAATAALVRHDRAGVEGIRFGLGVLLALLLPAPLLVSRRVALVCQLLVGLPITMFAFKSRAGWIDGWVNLPRPVELLSCVLMLPVPLIVSRHIFCRSDRLRQPAKAAPVAEQPECGQTLLWLVWRQERGWVAVIAGSALIAALLLPTVRPTTWPLFGLAVGLLGGLGTWGFDQRGEAYRFLGDLRLPPRWVWLAKVGLNDFFVVAALFVVTAGSALRLASLPVTAPSPDTGAIRAFQDQQTWVSLAAGPVYGFAAGQFFALICQKMIVSGALASFAGWLLLAFWVPAQVVSGWDVVQWIGPPLILLLATRLAYWPWVSNRLGSRDAASGRDLINRVLHLTRR